MRLFYKNNLHDYVALLSFLLSFSTFCKVLWYGVVFFLLLCIIGLLISSQALFVTGYGIAVIISVLNTFQLPVNIRLVLTRKTWFLCGNTYRKVLYLTAFIGFALTIFMLPFILQSFSDALDVVIVMLFIYGLYSFLIIFSAIYNSTIVIFFMAFMVFVVPDFDIKTIISIAPNISLVFGILFNVLVWGWAVFHWKLLSRPKNELVSLGQSFNREPSNSEINFYLKYFSRASTQKESILSIKVDPIYSVLTGKVKSGLLSIVYISICMLTLFFMGVFVQVFIMDGGYQTFISDGLFSNGYIFLLVLIAAVSDSSKLVRHSKRLWLVAGGGREVILNNLMQAFQYNALINFIGMLLLLIIVLFLSDSIGLTFFLMFAVAVFAYCSIIYLAIVSFCLQGLAKTRFHISFFLGCAICFGLYSGFDAVMGGIVASSLLLVIAVVVLLVTRHIAIRLWQYVDFQENRA